jgi:hypothetical protein
MPAAGEQARGGASGYRTLRLKDGRYLRLSIVRTPGPRGGHTLAAVRRRKGANSGR